MYKQIIILTLLSAAALANLSGWTDCGSMHATVHALRVGDCLQAPCTFVRNQPYLIEVDATSHSNSINMPFATTASFLGLNITLISGNACDYLRVGSCPAQNGQSFTFSYLYTVDPQLPPLPALVTSLLWNDFGDVAVCLQLQGNVA